MIDQIEKILENANFDKGAWIGFPVVKDNKVYFSAKGRDLYVAKKFRDIFGGTSIAGSVKVISKKMYRKDNGGFTITYAKEEMKNILEEMEEM